MTILLTVLHIICCSMLIIVILIQGGRGQGLTGNSFSSGNVQSLFGTRAADFLTKATTAAAICFLLTCIGLNWIETRKSKSLLSVNQASTADIDSIKKALEKVKAESASTAAAAADSAVAQATAAEEKLTQEVQAAVNQAAAATADATANKN